MRLNHLHFASPKAAATQMFYETFFQFRVHARIKDTVVLKDPGHFLLALDPVPDQAAPAPNTFHFGFCLETAEEVRTLYEEMKTAGVDFSSELRQLSENALNFYCLDPHGNRVEVGWYRNL